MNHLHWPRALRHSNDAAADFERCLELQLGAGKPNAKDYYLRTYVGLGDAYAKNKEYRNARRAWGDGFKVFPKSTELTERLAITDNGALLEYVQTERSLEQPIDTGLTFFDQAP
jgi:hypothetical protein